MRTKLFYFILIIGSFLFIHSCTGKTDTPENKGDALNIKLNESSLILYEGEYVVLVATIKPETVITPEIRWKSDNPNVAVVDNGKVTAIKQGTAIITAMLESNGKSATCKVTVKDNIEPSITIGATNISPVSVVLLGKANLTSTVASDITMGIMWSTSSGVLPSNSKKVEAINMDKDYNYSVLLTGLDPETTYYYRSYVTQRGVDTYGITKEFTTKTIASTIETIDATEISAASSVLNAKIDLEYLVAETLQYGFVYGLNNPINYCKVPLRDDGEKSISYSLTGLQPESSYHYQAYIIINGTEYRSVVKEFSTGKKVDLIETIDASNIEAASAQLNAKLDLSKVSYSRVSYGFIYGTSQDNLDKKIASKNLSKGHYSVFVSSLEHKTKYYFKAFVVLDNTAIYADIKELNTDLIHVASVSLNQHNYAFSCIGDKYTLRATVTPADATDKSLIWTSSNTNIATVSQEGIVTANDNGEATITVQTNDGQKTDNCTISVKQKVTSISINPSSINLKEGDVYSITVKVLPENAYDRSISWSSTDPRIATVDNSGIVKAVSKGSAVVTATANDVSGMDASCEVTVLRGVSGVSLNTHSAALYPGENLELKANVIPETADDKSVKWISVDPAIATVTSNGLVTGISSGTTTIIVRTNDGSFEDHCTISVLYHVAGISLDAELIELYPNETAKLKANIYPDNAYNKTVNWHSNNTNIASVSNDGDVLGVSSGGATIYATTEDGNHSATCNVIVKQYASEIVLNQTYAKIYANEPYSSSATIFPSSTSNKSISWHSSDVSVAEVFDGCVVPHKKGHVEISARTEDGSNLSAKCEIDVRNAVPEGAVDLGLSVYWAKCDLGATDNKTSGPLFAWGETSTKESFTLESYKFYNGTSYTKYTTDDGKHILDLEDDAAYCILKESWRMPTIDEYKELYNNCNVVQIGNTFIFTSRIDGYENNSITIPVRGFSPIKNKCLWTSSIYEKKEGGAILMNLGIDVVPGAWGYRFEGAPIRPVYEQ